MLVKLKLCSGPDLFLLIEVLADLSTAAADPKAEQTARPTETVLAEAGVPDPKDFLRVIQRELVRKLLDLTPTERLCAAERTVSICSVLGKRRSGVPPSVIEAKANFPGMWNHGAEDEPTRMVGDPSAEIATTTLEPWFLPAVLS